jgi:hypothetical protein
MAWPKKKAASSGERRGDITAFEGEENGALAFMATLERLYTFPPYYRSKGRIRPSALKAHLHEVFICYSHGSTDAKSPHLRPCIHCRF